MASSSYRGRPDGKGKSRAAVLSTQPSNGVSATTTGHHARAESPSAADDPLSRLRRLQAVPLRFLRFQAVRDRTGLSRSTIWRLERRGEFPLHRRISANAVGWLETEVVDWMLTKTATG
jgi:prophage regulatory protein